MLLAFQDRLSDAVISAAEMKSPPALHFNSAFHDVRVTDLYIVSLVFA
jgi:hypothetical protein